MMKKLSLVGQSFGRLKVLERAGVSPHGKTQWFCECRCGKQVTAIGSHLRSGNTRSCGCLHLDTITTHGHARDYKQTTEYFTWRSMKNRCYNRSNNYFYNYGGRGVQVCARWFKFENFLADMGMKPSRKHSIDRVNGDGHYMPSNCRWATTKEQAANKRKKAA